MQKLLALIVVVFLVGAGVYFLAANESAEPQTEVFVQSYFAEKIQQEASVFRANNPDKDFAGYTGGFSGFLIMDAFPGLVPSDFNGAAAKSYSGESGGEYSEKDGKLSFYGHAASDSANISPAGMATLLKNVSTRLSLEVRTTADIDTLLAAVREKRG